MEKNLELSKSSESPIITTVLLNWNRVHLLKKAVESYLNTVSVPYELIIVDNASTDDSRNYISSVCENQSNHTGIFLTRNLGGVALNFGFHFGKGQYFHSSGNDGEFLPGWDKHALAKFEEFPELGQLSLISSKPQTEKGEIWVTKPSTPITRNGVTILKTDYNIGMGGIFRKEIWKKGVRWKNIDSKSQKIMLPADGKFSKQIKELGYWIAWNDKYTIINWGHNIQEWQNHLEYYIKNYESKDRVGIEGFKNRLNENGYDLIQETNGKYKIIKKN